MEPAARREKILAAIVESYIGTGEPVGSKSLTGEHGLNVSSATVRNDATSFSRTPRRDASPPPVATATTSTT